MKTDKTHNATFLPALLLIWAIVFSVSSVAANPCTTVDGYLDTGIGIINPSNDSPPRKGIGGTGRSGDEDDKGIGGTGAVGNNNGIGGTGKISSQVNNKLIFITGTIHSFGSVCVNGIEIEYTVDTPVSTDTNQKLGASSLKVGQVVEIIAEKSAGKGMPKARNIAVRFPLQGKVTKINPDGRLINVRGKPVQLTGPQAGKSIQLGDNVRVSGLQNTAGQIVATYIETIPKQALTRTAPSKTKIIPSGISNFSVQGYVQRRTPEGNVIIEGQSFDLGVSGKDIEIGSRMIVSGKRQQDRVVKASSWVRERAIVETRPQFGGTKDSGRQNRGRGRGRGRGGEIKDDNSGRGRVERPGDNSKDDRIERPDNSGSGKDDRPDKADRPDNSGRSDRPTDRIDRSDRSGRSERPERPDRSGRGGGGSD